MSVPRAALPGTALLLVALAVLLPAASAQQGGTVLVSPDGAMRIEGRIEGYDGETYRVETVWGLITVDAAKVRCQSVCPAATPPRVTRISGAPRMGRLLLPALIEAYALENGYTARRDSPDDSHYNYSISRPDGPELLRLSVHLTSSEEAFADLFADEADLAMSLRPATSVEAQRGHEAGIGDLGRQGQAIALDATVVLTAPGTPLRHIGREALDTILGSSEPVWPAPARGPLALHVLAVPRPGLPPPQQAEIEPDAVTLAANVASDPAGLGLGRYSEIGNARVLPLAGSCGFQVKAATATIRSGDYPLAAPMLLYHSASTQSLALRNFLDYLISPQAQPVIRRAGFVDMAISATGIEDEGRRLAQALIAASPEGLPKVQRLAGDLINGRRLSPTFRFEGASLDTTSSTQIGNLATALQAGFYDDQRLVFTGFATGPDAIDRSRLMAETALAALRRALPEPATAVDLGASGYGDALPILCDEDPWGDQVNNRVELWLYRK